MEKKNGPPKGRRVAVNSIGRKLVSRNALPDWYRVETILGGPVYDKGQALVWGKDEGLFSIQYIRTDTNIHFMAFIHDGEYVEEYEWVNTFDAPSKFLEDICGIRNNRH